MGDIGRAEDSTSSKHILLARMDRQWKSDGVFAFELYVASLKKRVYMLLERELCLLWNSLIFVMKPSRVLVCYTR